ncbi:type II toxin-antitoxin system RelE/ParE family toxin [Xenorhabdus bovienii]|uniref:type II toxin-antitoxin system RelE family toxin n=1 Tax=Xenorhabdus bovienii TaxID=40576 RepID=UPI00237C5CCA|nr:type II toxin-antitoxin system RelE/ParE family toxin [Xenorhabdus bovienii]MDE1476320.1 type II toxin-antitoxin system RelE/ParE family toxin [Xenorhabdus bovienii]MDE9543497.1 type II toxin-antitoxin system RelE/ParE family toxin [Xenorhabdus bovienii]MDE9563986.1 type II toxin-antitoxin system RelE/ParE family toxin [Xenorhabdus bovienii]
MVKVIWSKAATKQLIRIDTRYQKAIKNKVSLLTGFPLVDLDIKKLTGTEVRYRLRVGDYRILFELSGKEPKILEVQEVKRRQTNTY